MDECAQTAPSDAGHEQPMVVRIVVAAALFDRGRLLAARRSAPPELAGRWELPGVH